MCGDYTFYTRKASDPSKPFIHHEGLALTGVTPYATQNAKNYENCVQACSNKPTECRSINVVKREGGGYKCKFFSISLGVFKKREGE